MIRGGGTRTAPMALVPREKMDPPPQRLGADAHECIIGKVQTQSTEYQAVVRSFAPERELPSDTLATSLGLFTGRRRLTPGGRSTPACGQAADIEATSKWSPPSTEHP